jgi:fatty-acid desaturase
VYHKFFAHRSFTPKKWVPYLGSVIGVLVCGFNAPLIFVAGHRIHHRYSDTELDPHTPIYGKKYVFFPFINKPKDAKNIEFSHKVEFSHFTNLAAKDLVRDYPLIAKITARNSFFASVGFILITLLISYELFLFLLTVRFVSAMFVHHSNAFNHSLNSNNEPVIKNIKPLAWLFAENNHKFHHEKPWAWDYSLPNAPDWTSYLIKYVLMDKSKQQPQ